MMDYLPPPSLLAPPAYVRRESGLVAPARSPARWAVLPGLAPLLIPGAAGAAPTVTYAASATNGANTDTYTYSSVNIGAAASNRTLLLGVYDNAGGELTGVTVNSVATTPLVSHTSGFLHFHFVVLPAGTSATIVATYSGSTVRNALVVWAVYGLASTTLVDSAQASGSTGGSLNLDTLLNGVVLVYGWTTGTSGNQSVTFSGATERLDNESIEVAALEHAAADASGVAAATPRSVSATVSSGTGSNFLAVSLR